MNDLVSRAYTAYFAACRRAGALEDQPLTAASGEQTLGDLRYVVLRNSQRTLAVYRVRADGTLRTMRRWPGELDAW